jgi:hypothetical protein
MSNSTVMISSLDRELLREQARGARPFPYLLIDDFLDTEFAHEVLNSWPSYEDAAKMAKSFAR